ncbi:hypothetical protein JCGZ_07833 [Jatropha curcas]|uniref:Uncharacterized protein n=1 Tax=Jatropha curcas TaxID=180498 RepID=A0A067L0L4_JATCU|nr:hypothetical protein JCGZ_07833 [Jatropha curcas]
MVHMKLMEKVGYSYCVVGTRDESSNDEEAEAANETNMEEGNLTPFPSFGTSSGASTSRAGPFQEASNLSNDEALVQRNFSTWGS